MAKGTFVFYKSILESIEVLTDDTRRINDAMGAVIRYGVRGEEYQGDDIIIKCAMLQAMPLIDADKAKTNGGGTGAPKGNRNAAKQTIGLKKQTIGLKKQTIGLKKQTIGLNETNHRFEKTNHRFEKTNLSPSEYIIDVDVDKDVDKDVDIDVDIDKDLDLERESDARARARRTHPTPTKKSSFVKDNPPTIEEVKAYMSEKGYSNFTAEQFVGYYSSQDWNKANGQPLTNWKGAVVTFASSQYNSNIDHTKERKQTLVQDDSPYGKFNAWLFDNAPYLVAHCDELLTEDQFYELLSSAGNKHISRAIKQIESNNGKRKNCAILNTELKELIKKNIDSDKRYGQAQ